VWYGGRTVSVVVAGVYEHRIAAPLGIIDREAKSGEKKNTVQAPKLSG